MHIAWVGVDCLLFVVRYSQVHIKWVARLEEEVSEAACTLGAYAQAHNSDWMSSTACVRNTAADMGQPCPIPLQNWRGDVRDPQLTSTLNAQVPHVIHVCLAVLQTRRSGEDRRSACDTPHGPRQARCDQVSAWLP